MNKKISKKRPTHRVEDTQELALVRRKGAQETTHNKRKRCVTPRLGHHVLTTALL